jgi:hypothetical protein
MSYEQTLHQEFLNRQLTAKFMVHSKFCLWVRIEYYGREAPQLEILLVFLHNWTLVFQCLLVKKMLCIEYSYILSSPFTMVV